jgi:hypothetical protein
MKSQFVPSNPSISCRCEIDVSPTCHVVTYRCGSQGRIHHQVWRMSLDVELSNQSCLVCVCGANEVILPWFWVTNWHKWPKKRGTYQPTGLSISWHGRTWNRGIFDGSNVDFVDFVLDHLKLWCQLWFVLHGRSPKQHTTDNRSPLGHFWWRISREDPRAKAEPYWWLQSPYPPWCWNIYQHLP